MSPSVLPHSSGSWSHRARIKAFLPLLSDRHNGQAPKGHPGRHSELGWRRVRYFFFYGLLPFSVMMFYFRIASSNASASGLPHQDPLVRQRLDQLPSAFISDIDTMLKNTTFLYFDDKDPEEEQSLVNDQIHPCTKRPPNWPPPPKNTNGYLLVRSNGGLNQMRAAICDMVAVARLINATMVIPELDKTSFWADQSNFADVFDLQHFMDFLKDEISIVERLPPQYSHLTNDNVYTMDPVSWSDTGYYLSVLLPLLKKHEVIRLYQTDSRLANNPPDVPRSLQKLRCRVQFHALQFTPALRRLGKKIVRRLHKQGPFIALHLRYEMDMLAFTGCTHGCTKSEEHNLTRLRYRTARWREKDIDGVQRRHAGECPLTPEEVALALRAMGYNRSTQIYVASGKIYGGKRRLARFLSVFPNTLRKEMLVTADELAPFRNHSSQLAALDYMVSVAADVFLSTFHGNMARLVEGHRRYLGFRKTLLPNRKRLVELFEAYENGSISWKKLSAKVVKVHKDRLGGPAQRSVVPGHPKEEDNFFQNPQECICTNEELESGLSDDDSVDLHHALTETTSQLPALESLKANPHTNTTLPKDSHQGEQVNRKLEGKKEKFALHKGGDDTLQEDTGLQGVSQSSHESSENGGSAVEEGGLDRTMLALLNQRHNLSSV